MSEDEDKARRKSRHIRRTRKVLSPLSWCGVDLTSADWVFNDIDHAITSVRGGSGIPICPACVEVVTDALRAGKGEAT